MKISWRSIIAVFFIVLLLGVQVMYWSISLSLSDIIVLRDLLFSYTNEYPILSALIYMMAYILSIIFGIPISATIIGGYFFGIFKGILYSIISMIIGTAILCSLVRHVIGDWIQKRYKDELKPFNKEIKKYGISYILIIHMIPFMPSFLPNVATAVSNVPLYSIIAMNVLGALPLTILYAVAGSYINEIDSWQSLFYYIAGFGLILGLLVLAIVMYRRLAQD